MGDGKRRAPLFDKVKERRAHKIDDGLKPNIFIGLSKVDGQKLDSRYTAWSRFAQQGKQKASLRILNFFFKSKAKNKAITNENEKKKLLKTAVTRLIITNWMESKCLFSGVVFSISITKTVL